MNPAKIELMPRPSRGLRSDAVALRRSAPDQTEIARRRSLVTLAKRLLPAVALILLTLVAIWPEIDHDITARRLAFRRSLVEPDSGQLTHPRYNGVDERGEAYTLTADSSRQLGPDRINLDAPVGDLTLSSGTWLLARGSGGVYVKAASQLDLTGEVTLYRDDGTTFTTDAVTIDLRQGVASSADQVHAEGPFGVLDAQGFTLTDRGEVIRFLGPSRLLLNAASSHSAVPQVKDKPGS